MSNLRRHRAAGTIATLAFAPLLLLACGSDDASDDGETPAPAATAPPTDSPTTEVPGTESPAPSAEPGGEVSGPVLTIVEFEFSRLTVAAGTTFTVSNDDGFAHTVTARDESFDVRVESGANEPVTAPAPGTYEIFCKIHPSMEGSIIVE
jgi:plastocyanin